MHKRMNDMLLGGLSADNPLGYLAALGVLRTATLAVQENRFEMSWELVNGRWQPRLLSSTEIDRTTLIDLLDRQLKDSAGLAAFSIGEDLKVNVKDFRAALVECRSSASAEDRRNADFLAAFGSDVIESKENNKLTGRIADTDFRTMGGAGHQHFLKTMRTLIEDTRLCHLEKAVFEPWVYDDPLKNHSMRWDPIDDNRYALRWDNPSKDPTRKKSGSVWGGNRLAIEALPLFPTQPRQSKLETTGFSQRNGAVELSWPVWSPPIDLSTVRSLLSLEELQKDQPDRKSLIRMGIVEVFRSQRITQGNYRNFVTANPPLDTGFSV